MPEIMRRKILKAKKFFLIFFFLTSFVSLIIVLFPGAFMSVMESKIVFTLIPRSIYFSFITNGIKLDFLGLGCNSYGLIGYKSSFAIGVPGASKYNGLQEIDGIKIYYFSTHDFEYISNYLGDKLVEVNKITVTKLRKLPEITEITVTVY